MTEAEQLANWIWHRYGSLVPSANWELEYTELLNRIWRITKSGRSAERKGKGQ